MSKMSVMSLVLGLLFLGALFFVLGFLAAVATLKSNDEGQHNSQLAWQASNEHLKGGQGMNRMAGGLLTKAIGKPLASLGQAMGKSSMVVPRPLQPFARYGTGVVAAEERYIVKQANPFGHHRRGELQYYGTPQQSLYGGGQGQAYGPPATPVGYQQPTVSPQQWQAGYRQGYVPQQPVMGGQQPAYPQQPMYPSYPAAYQPPLPPQQQQMMGQPQYPSYPQPSYAQGYYR